MKEEAHRRYGEILKDVEAMIDDHSKGSLPAPRPPVITYEES
jgi:hypothetical protein